MREVQMKEYKDIILNVLIEVDAICRKHDLVYSLGDGTLLGAVRHKGFIPWDDDIDIYMPINDYNRLAAIIRSENREINIIRIEDQDDTCFPFGKICAKETIIKESNLQSIKGYGAYIDVFPLCKIPGNKKWNNEKKWKIIKTLAAYSKLERYTKSSSWIKNLGRLCEFQLSKLLNTKKLVKRIVDDSNAVNTEVEKNNLDFSYGLLWSKYRFPKNIFEDQVEIEFEGHRFFGTKDPDKILSIIYGDYRKLPPVENQIPQHTLKCYAAK